MIYKTLLKQTLLLVNTPNFDTLKNDILNKIKDLNDTSYYFIHLDVLKAINNLKTSIENKKIYTMKNYLESELILIEHKIEVEDLSWHNTLLLKLFK